MTLDSRVALLERASSPSSRVIVLDGPEGIDVDAHLRQRRIITSARDLVVVMSDTVTGVVAVTVDGLSAG